MSVKTYQDLLVWQKSMEYVVLCYELTKFFPKDEVFGLSLQLKKSSVSVPSNIAEGFGRLNRSLKVYFRRKTKRGFGKSKRSWDFVKEIN